jgi:TfoX/Sxy family transcriptional regulator of competence genes
MHMAISQAAKWKIVMSANYTRCRIEPPEITNADYSTNAVIAAQRFFDNASLNSAIMDMPKTPQSLAELFDRILPEDDAVVRKKMFGYPAAFVNGNLFTGLHGEAVIVRLGPEKREELLSHPGAGQFEPMPGRPMREYVRIADEMLKDEAEVKRWIGQAHEFVSALPAKEAKPKKPRKK